MREQIANPNDYYNITHHLPKLLVSEDLHDLRGAQYCAQYLVAHDGDTRETRNLVGTIDNVADVVEKADKSQGMNNLRQLYIGESLVMLAEYKHAYGRGVDYTHAILDFSKAIYAVDSRRARVRICGLLGQYYRAILSRDPDTTTNSELVSAMGAKQIYDESVTAFESGIAAIFEHRDFKKRTDHVSKERLYPVSRR